MFQRSIRSKKYQILKITLPHWNSATIQTPYPKLMIMVSFCWKIDILPKWNTKQLCFIDDVHEINDQSRCILSGPPCIHPVEIVPQWGVVIEPLPHPTYTTPRHYHRPHNCYEIATSHCMLRKPLYMTFTEPLYLRVWPRFSNWLKGIRVKIKKCKFAIWKVCDFKNVCMRCMHESACSRSSVWRSVYRNLILRIYMITQKL